MLLLVLNNQRLYVSPELLTLFLLTSLHSFQTSKTSTNYHQPSIIHYSFLKQIFFISAKHDQLQYPFVKIIASVEVG